MDDHDCSRCLYYSYMNDWCYRYREMHYPSDGAGCPGWEYWDMNAGTVQGEEELKSAEYEQAEGGNESE